MDSHTPLNVLSLFDGISCARVALERVKFPLGTYYASEIDKHAIAVSQKNYPDIVRLGDVRALQESPAPIYLLIGGSPCTDLSIAKKDRQGLAGSQSSLFWEYKRVLDLVKPTYFLLENVASMPKADRQTITETLGVEPILIDAALVSAQSRKRLFWTNIPNVALPGDRGILLRDILQPDAEVDPSMVVDGKAFCLTASYHKVGEGQTEYEHNKEKRQRTMVLTSEKAEKAKEDPHSFIQVGYFGAENQCKVGGQALRVYSDEGKTPTMGSFAPIIKVGHVGEKERQNNRVYSDAGKAPTQCKGPNGGATPTLVKIGHIGKDDAQANRVYDPSGKSVTLSANGGGLGAKTGLYQTESRIRKLTPIECERLQSLPDNYTEGVAKTHRYKCLGNGFNVEVIAHILTHLQTPA